MIYSGFLSSRWFGVGGRSTNFLASAVVEDRVQVFVKSLDMHFLSHIDRFLHGLQVAFTTRTLRVASYLALGVWIPTFLVTGS